MGGEDAKGVVGTGGVEFGVEEELDPLGVGVCGDPVERVFDGIRRLGADGEAQRRRIAGRWLGGKRRVLGLACEDGVEVRQGVIDLEVGAELAGGCIADGGVHGQSGKVERVGGGPCAR